MAPRKSQSANLTSSSKTLDSSSIPSKVSFTASDTLVTPTTDVSEFPSLPTESSSSTTEKDIEKPPSNSTEIYEAPTKSGDGSDSRTAPIATEDPATKGPNSFSYNHQIAPVNGTVIEDPSIDIPTSDESTSGDHKTAASSSSDLGALVRTSSPPPPSESESPNRVGNEGSGNPPPPSNLAVSATGTYNTAPLPFSLATAFTSEGTVYVMSTFASTFETTLPNGSVTTTAKAFTTQVPAPSAEANVNTNGDGERPRPNPGPFTEFPTSSETFFQRPAAAAGVFVVVLLIFGSLIWMFLIIRLHRRQIAAAVKERKRPSYMYGSTGISPRDRRSYMSYESHNWPQRFERNSVDNAASTSRAAPAPAPNPAVVLQRRPGYVSATTDFENPHMDVVFASPGSSVPQHHPVLRSQSRKGHPILHISSPPIRPSSPLRPGSPPARTPNVVTEDVYYRGEYAHAAASGSNQHSPNSSSGLLVPSMLMAISRNSSNQPPRRRASSSTSLHSHPYAVANTSSLVAPQFPANIRSTSRNVFERRLSDISSYGSAENPFCSSAYILPSPTSSAELQGSNERLSNPFDDAESPPHSPAAFTYVRNGGATQTVVPERGVSLLRNDSLRNRPEHKQNSYLPQGPSIAEWGSSGGEAASSSIHLNANASSRAASGYRVMQRRVARASESISTAETSVANSVHRIGSLDSDELFYNPTLAVASPVRDNNPQFLEIRG